MWHTVLYKETAMVVSLSPLHGDAEGLEEADPLGAVVLEKAQQPDEISRELPLDGCLVAHEHAVPKPAPDLSGETKVLSVSIFRQAWSRA